jgi:hypothetical protein
MNTILLPFSVSLVTKAFDVAMICFCQAVRSIQQVLRAQQPPPRFGDAP